MSSEELGQVHGFEENDESPLANGHGFHVVIRPDPTKAPAMSGLRLPERIVMAPIANPRAVGHSSSPGEQASAGVSAGSA